MLLRTGLHAAARPGSSGKVCRRNSLAGKATDGHVTSQKGSTLLQWMHGCIAPSALMQQPRLAYTGNLPGVYSQLVALLQEVRSQLRYHTDPYLWLSVYLIPEFLPKQISL